MTLTEARKAAEGKTVSIYADSQYALGVIHEFGAFWKHSRFLKSDVKPCLPETCLNSLLY